MTKMTLQSDFFPANACCFVDSLPLSSSSRYPIRLQILAVPRCGEDSLPKAYSRKIAEKQHCNNKIDQFGRGRTHASILAQVRRLSSNYRGHLEGQLRARVFSSFFLSFFLNSDLPASRKAFPEPRLKATFLVLRWGCFHLLSVDTHF